MDYNVETPEVTAQLVNSSFVRKIDEGRVKEAAEESTAFIREKLRQEAAVREILAPEGISEEEIDRDEDTDQPKKIIDKEPDSYATFVQFQGVGPRTWFKGPRYAIYFGKIESQRFTKVKWELMTYTSDIRKILSDNSVKDMADEEDSKWNELVTDIINANPLEQRTAGAFQSSTFKQAMQKMLGRRRPIGKMLMTKLRYMDALDLPAVTVGDDIASRHFDQGIEATERLWGIPVVTTIKSDIYDPDKAWIFAPQKPNNFLGNFYLLQDATLFIKQEADVIMFWSYEALGIGVGNRLSMQEIQF
ncbi:MAG: hypothetical protein DRP83_00025 [Planctomycetota bacterium]|nr:MAG: hypothetical protein DRP83_00025 [Planctomycetota bacterium]